MSIVRSILSRNDCNPGMYTARSLLVNCQVIVYGFGEGYTALKRTVLTPLGIRPKLVVDQKFDDEVVNDGVRHVDLDALKQVLYEYLDSVVIVSLGNKRTADCVRYDLEELGFKSIYWAPDIYEFSLHHDNQNIIDEGESFFLKHESDIDNAYKSLADDESKNVFEMLLKRYMTGVPDEISAAPYDEQYLPQDVQLAKGSAQYVCCGAYNGDSIDKIVNLHGKRCAVYAFEPDQENYQLLTAYLAEKAGAVAENIASFPCGVYSETKFLQFTAGDGLSSTIDEQGEEIVLVVALDQALSGSQISYITMDVEGAEMDALEGAQNIITECGPDLAISVYHTPEHLWKIALFLEKLNLGYSLYMRNYSGFTYETLLYATIE